MRRLLLVILIASTLTCGATAADRLILRDLTILTDRTVESFDEDGVRLDDGTLVTWDRVERGSIAADKQAAFEKLRIEIGQPLFRLRLRLKVGDDLGLAELAESLAPRFAERSGPSALLVQRALMRGRLARGQREAAVEPYFHCLALASSSAGARFEFPVELRMVVESATGLTPELLPVWFDVAAAQAALPGVRQAAARIPEPRPDALRIYFGSLAAAAGDTTAAERAIAGIGATETAPEVVQRGADWRETLRVASDVQAGSGGANVDQLEARIDELPAAARTIARYWIGRARLRSERPEQQRDGVLHLLRLPATLETEQPELAAQALLAAITALERLDDRAGATALRRELTVRYAHTSAAKSLPAAP